MKKAVVIFSGGQDSTTCLYWALNRHDKVEAIIFKYGQKHAVEIEQARLICEKAGVNLMEINLSFLGSIVDSALTSNGDVNEINEKGLPASFVPNRNQLFITLAHAYAQKIGAINIVTGVCQTDYSGYPDCRMQFISIIQRATNTGSQSEIKILVPLMYLTKAETFALAKEEGCFDEVVELSHTCYEGSREPNDWGAGCGKCPACVLRKKGFEEYIGQLNLDL